MNAKILITARSFAKATKAKALLEAAGYQLVFNPHDRPLNEQELLTLISGASALIAGLDEVTGSVITAGRPTLKIIAKYGVGYENIDISAARDQGVAVTITPGANTKSVAELTMALMLTTARRITEMDRSVRQGTCQRLIGCELAGKVLGIIGLGNIGSEVAKRAAAFDMNIIAYDILPRFTLTQQYGVSYKSLAEVLTEADFLSLHTPSTPETTGIINKTTLARMKKSAILINTARSDLIKEADLYDALKSGSLAAAGLDTFAHELQGSRLLTLDNIVVTPHAGANTYEAVRRMGISAAEEVIRVLSGQQPRHPVKADKPKV